MGERSEALAAQFEKAIAELVEAVDQCSDKQWQALCGDERWTVAATAHHVGAQWPLEREYLVAAAEGRQMPAYTWDDINGKNEQHAKEFSACSKGEVIALLRDGMATMAAYVRNLSDEQLDRTAALPLANGASVSTTQLIEGGVLIDHAKVHAQSIRTAG